MLLSQAERRRVRMRNMCARLTKLGLPGAALHAAVQANPGVPTRSHLAAAMVAAGHVGRADDAFRRYLGAGRAAHVAAEWPALAQIVAWIRDAGGVAALAHPARYTLSSGARKQLAGRFRRGRRHRARSGDRRQRRAAFGNLRGARGAIRTLGIDRLGLSQSTTNLESFGPVG